jgi:hypothetical protein
MEATVKGVRITLTNDQIKIIEDHHSKQKQECTTFTKTLKSFGFKKMSTKGWANPDANAWISRNWFAEIHKERTYTICQISGSGIPLDKSGYPLQVETPEELCEVLNKALEEIEDTPNRV